MRWFCGDNPDQSQDVIRLAYESGVNVFDISDAVSADRAEVELGRAARAGHWPRRNFVVCTKVFWSR
jgi:aryl-alcohol dehydrogenase-like predicted oxidoreductase